MSETIDPVEVQRMRRYGLTEEQKAFINELDPSVYGGLISLLKSKISDRIESFGYDNNRIELLTEEKYDAIRNLGGWLQIARLQQLAKVTNEQLRAMANQQSR